MLFLVFLCRKLQTSLNHKPSKLPELRNPHRHPRLALTLLHSQVPLISLTLTNLGGEGFVNTNHVFPVKIRFA